MPSEGVYVGADGDGPREEETIRALKPRQISMIAIGGAIGTGKSHERQRPNTIQ
jgi:amino acid transporter